MLEQHREALKPYARKYIWWKSPEDAVALPQRVVAQVMNLGDYRDVQALDALLGEIALKEVLVQAEAGQFEPRSWAYWHYRLGMCEVEQVPPMPVRSFE